MNVSDFAHQLPFVNAHYHMVSHVHWQCKICGEQPNAYPPWHWDYSHSYANCWDLKVWILHYLLHHPLILLRGVTNHL